MKRRTFVAGLGATLGTLGGCSTRGGVSDGTNAPETEPRSNGPSSPSRTPTPAAPSTETTPDQLLRDARSDLNAALRELNQIDAFDGTQVVASERDFRRFDPERVARHETSAVTALDEYVTRQGDSDQAARYLRSVARLVRAARDLLGQFRGVYRNGWLFEEHYYYALWDRATAHAQNAGQLCSEWPEQGERLADELRIIDDLEEPDLEAFDRTRWETWAVFATGASEAMVATFDGFERISRCWPAFDEAHFALAVDSFDDAQEGFASAHALAAAANTQFVRAKAAGLESFRLFAQTLFERSPGIVEGMETFEQAAAAHSRGAESTGERLTRRAEEQLDRARDEHPLPLPTTERR